MIEKCRACGSTNMDDPQAQEMKSCSARCAKMLASRNMRAYAALSDAIEAVGPGDPLEEPITDLLVEVMERLTESEKDFLSRRRR